MQLVAIVGAAAFVRNSHVVLYAIVVSSFLPPALAVALSRNKYFTISSLGILIITQHFINSLSHPSYAFVWGSDGMNDLHVARALASEQFFELGHVGYTERAPDLSFYLYPHLFLVTFSNGLGLDLYFTANYIFPVINGILVSYGLYTLYGIMFREEPTEQGLGVLVYATCFYFDFFQSFFVRETFAFPLGIIFLGMLLKYSRLYKNRPFGLEKCGKEDSPDGISAERARTDSPENSDGAGLSEDDRGLGIKDETGGIEGLHVEPAGFEGHTKSTMFFIAVFGATIVVSHHFTSYLMLLILLSVSLYGSLIRVKDPHNHFVTAIFALILVLWVANVTITLALQQGYATWASVQSVLTGVRSGSSSGSAIMAESYIWEKYLTYIYYAIFFILAAYGILFIIRKTKRSYTGLFVLFCIGLLLFSTAARLTTSDKWTYNLAVRAMTWLYIGSAPLVAFTLLRFVSIGFQSATFTRKRYSIREHAQCGKWQVAFAIFVVLVLSAGYFAQYYPGVKTRAGSQGEKLSNPYWNYRAATWLDYHSPNGSLLLYDRNNTELSYSFEPYSNTILFHQENYYTNFEGYIPIYPEGDNEHLQYLREVDTIYDNGNVKIGYTQGGI